MYFAKVYLLVSIASKGVLRSTTTLTAVRNRASAGSCTRINGEIAQVLIAGHQGCRVARKSCLPGNILPQQLVGQLVEKGCEVLCFRASISVSCKYVGDVGKQSLKTRIVCKLLSKVSSNHSLAIHNRHTHTWLGGSTCKNSARYRIFPRLTTC